MWDGQTLLRDTLVFYGQVLAVKLLDVDPPNTVSQTMFSFGINSIYFIWHSN